MKKEQIPLIEVEKLERKPVFRLLEKNDLQSILTLMIKIKPMIGGVRYKYFYRALCSEALIDKRVVFTVCEEESKIIGFRVAIIDLRSWKISFFIRHPIVMVGVIFGRALNKFNKMLKKVRKEKKSNLNNMLNINDLISSNFTTKSWSDCTPFIAKSLFVAVEEGYRGKKIASRLIQYSNKILAELGVKRVDSKILIDNISAIRLNHRLGYNIYKKGTSLFSTKDL